jgi:hypothetical protein
MADPYGGPGRPQPPWTVTERPRILPNGCRGRFAFARLSALGNRVVLPRCQNDAVRRADDAIVTRLRVSVAPAGARRIDVEHLGTREGPPLLNPSF